MSGDGHRVVVTGGSGLIGSATVAAIRARAATAISIGRAGSCQISCDVREPESVRRALASAAPSTVIHTAYMLADQTASAAREAIAVNLLGFLNCTPARSRCMTASATATRPASPRAHRTGR